MVAATGAFIPNLRYEVYYTYWIKRLFKYGKYTFVLRNNEYIFNRCRKNCEECSRFERDMVLDLEDMPKSIFYSNKVVWDYYKIDWEKYDTDEKNKKKKAKKPTK